jgi:Helix-turn-helix domain
VAIEIGDRELTTLDDGDVALVTQDAGHRQCSSARSGWLGALRDDQIDSARAHPRRPVARVDCRRPRRRAGDVTLGVRGAVHRAVGEPIMRCVTRGRMRVAINALRDEGATVAELADRLGYRSEAAFARAVKRVTGVAPGAIKRARAGTRPRALGHRPRRVGVNRGTARGRRGRI